MKTDQLALNAIMEQWIEKDEEVARIFNAVIPFIQSNESHISEVLLERLSDIVGDRFRSYAGTKAMERRNR